MKVILSILFSAYLCGVSSSSSISNSIEITIPQGKLKGSFNFFRTYRRFMGIPYASLQARFQEPGPPPSWNETFDASYRSVRCKQFFRQIKLPIGREDCLTLNIYTPINTQPKALPVMVFIHGGGFYWGSNTNLIYNPKYLLKKNVVVVTINYRIGALGFLCLRNKGAPGNAGLKDQVAALKWVKTNIGYFGGNPNSITLFGESVGAASVNYLLVIPAARGLFHRAIMQSGSILMPQIFTYDPIERASSIATKLGYNSTDPDELLDIFNEVSVDEIITASYQDQTNDASAPYVFRLCIEAPSENSLITSSPLEILRTANLNSNSKLIIGFNDKEGIKWASKYNDKGLQKLNENFTSILPENIHIPNEIDKLELIRNIKELYFNTKPISSDSLDGLIDYFSDTYIRYPSMATTDYMLKHTNATVYNYYFKYDSYRNLAKITSGLGTVHGADHGDELFYLFEPLIFQPLPTSSKDIAMISRMTRMWTYFAKTGNPTISPTLIPWIKSTSNKLNFLQIDNKLKMMSTPDEERIVFWRKVYDKYGIK